MLTEGDRALGDERADVAEAEDGERLTRDLATDELRVRVSVSTTDNCT